MWMDHHNDVSQTVCRMRPLGFFAFFRVNFLAANTVGHNFVPFQTRSPDDSSVEIPFPEKDGLFNIY